jgi:branched-chain amino acid transport system ATP-binding protein
MARAPSPHPGEHARKTQATEPLLSCQGVSKYFGALAAVDGLSFDVHSGDVLGIAGPNGAGKTTLFDLVSGITGPDFGTVYFNGQAIHRRSADRIRHLGIARTFQLNAVYDTLTVRENVLCASYFGYRNVIFPKLRFDRESQRRADESLEFVGLSDWANVVAANLPVLQLKFLMIATALASDPKLLLLDEPVGGLNGSEIDIVFELLESVRKEQEITIILIEHVMRFLVAASERVMILHHGQKLYEGSPQGLTRDKAVVEVYLGETVAKRLHRFF